MKLRIRSRPFGLRTDGFAPQAFLARRMRRAGILSGLGLVLGLLPALTADFAVTYPGNPPSTYAFNGTGANPTITLIRGETYTFSVNTPGSHPFRILNAPAAALTGNNTSFGTITFKVPTNTVNYAYECSVHHFGGQILTIAPPTFRIVNLKVGQNIVVKSTGTNNWSLAPQYSTNLGATNWFALTVQSNRVVNGTNETFCGRPLGSNVFVRIKATRN
jgi:hypothetical protein